jgi:branched-chain amino acid transport system substrate-binding protein
VNPSAWLRYVPALVLPLALALGGCGKKKDENSIVVGHFASMTGAEATFGISTDNAIKLAIQERNAKGGVKGKKIVLQTIDDASKTSEAATAVTRLINDYGAVAILGEVASGRSLAGGPIAQNAKIPMISPSSTNPSVTDVGDYVFRVCFLDDFQGWAGAKFARENLKAERAAILYDQAQAYSSGLADFFEKAFKEMGGTIVVRQAFNGANPEISSQLQAIKGADAQIIYMPGYYGPAATIIRKAREAGITTPFLGGDGWDSEQLAKNAGDAINGNYFTNHYAPEENRPEVKNFVEKYKATYGAVPDGLAALGYDAALVLFDAMDRAKSLSGPDLRDAIAQTKSFTGVTGTFSIDAKRNAQKSAVVIVYENGKQKMAARIEKK